MTDPQSGSITAEQAQEQAAEATNRHRSLSPVWMALLVTSAMSSVFMAVYVIFNLGIHVGIVPLDTQYFYAMLAALLPLVFLLYPVWPGIGPQDRVPWYDIILAAFAFSIPVYFVFTGESIIDEGWEYDAPQHAVYMTFIFWIIGLEAARRAGGLVIFLICLLFSLYPILAPYAPGFLEGEPNDWADTATYHVFGTESLIGVPMEAFANLVVGFLIFGVALQFTGGGTFFLNLAFALLGKRRGGPAKVAIFSSGLMGSMSGSVITNVLTTGVMSIPAMKRVGFRPAYAGGVEACASTGGVLMPPIMGATAFVMAVFLEIPYSDIAIAAIIPSLLYFFALFMQIDAYSARYDLSGLPLSELPTLREVLRDGWYFVVVFLVLIYMLLYMQQEAQAPFYATAMLLVINQIAKQHRWGWRELSDFVVGVGKLFTELAAILAGIGLIIGSLSLTGKVGTIAYELVAFAGGNTILLLIMGAVTCFVLGIGMTITAAYLFLAITLAPGLAKSGLNDLAIHMFILYWAMISFITPPVAIGAYAAAGIAQSNPLKTGLEAMRLGTIIYFVPFFFVLNPALLGIGEPMEVIIVFFAALAGIILVSAGLQGYLIGAGTLGSGTNPLHWLLRLALFASGMMLALPGGEIVGFTHLELNVTAAFIGIPAVALTWMINRGGGRQSGVATT
ncbi:MAG: TRAP transporter fused permease subunit [Rhodospirillaceae bacterium]|jgi:TRAP transporter 4TM/12TM fusion protein|nr:TRAP transporter fused permease subunit [Rhodospirillaceae bacterium]MBT6426467.1 TRAP transporter fused permease subunit [Rhodospirillaceae bacterium]MBT7760931.1 TRAP transporter fused permease subunit [Rhodospirillaceae bacterium]